MVICSSFNLLTSWSVELCPSWRKERLDPLTDIHQWFNLTSKKHSFIFAISNEQRPDPVGISSNIEHISFSIIDSKSKDSIKASEEEIRIIKFFEQRPKNRTIRVWFSLQTMSISQIHPIVNLTITSPMNIVMLHRLVSFRCESVQSQSGETNGTITKFFNLPILRPPPIQLSRTMLSSITFCANTCPNSTHSF